MSALTALGGTWHCDGFTYDNATGRCLLFRAPLRPHTAGAENNTSGSWISLGPLPPPPPPPGPPAPVVPFPAAQPTIPATPTFAKPPRPNIVLFFGDGAPPCCVSSLPPLPLPPAEQELRGEDPSIPSLSLPSRSRPPL